MRVVNGRRFIERNEVRIGDQIRVFEPGTPVEQRQITESWHVEGIERGPGVWVFIVEVGVMIPVAYGEEVELVSRASERRAAAVGGRR